MCCRCVPVVAGNAKAFMRCLHVAPGVETRAARRCAKLIDYVLANLLQRVFAVTDKKLCEALVAYQAADEIVDHCGNCVIPAESCVKRLLLLAHGRRGR